MSSKSAAIKPIDPTEWANRRKAAVERARLKREELKSGITQDEHTFAPQINKRPAYLDTNKNKDSLDALTAVYNNPTNDIFEKPLPGNKSYTENRKPPSPNSDALGRELNRYPKNESSNNNIPLDVHNNNYNNNVNTNKVDDSELFMNLLRSDNKKNAGPGWNDDFTTANAFDNLKKPPNGRKSKVISNNKPEINEQPRQRNIDKPKDNWNNEFNLDLPIKPMKTSPTISPRLNNDQLAISQARSKLHILKSKIRRSESGGSARPQPDESFTSAKSDSLVSIIPKSAPYDFNSDPYKRGNEIPISNTIDKRNNNSNNNKPIEAISQSNYQPSFQSNKPPIRKPINRYENENIDNNPHNGVSSPRINNSTNINKIENDYNEEDEDNNQSNNLSEYENLELFECPDCGRKFNEVALKKHAKICAKVFLQKRKVFDTTKMRIQDNPDLVKLLKEKKKRTRNVKSTTQIETPATAILRNREDAPINGEKQSKWKEQSKQFRDVMKQARLASQAIKNGDPLPPVVLSTPDPSLIQCPHCERRFNDKAAERHIPLCTNIRAKPNTLKRGQGGGGGINGTLTSNNNSAMKKSIRR
eukprot:CAMPEP_0196761346 /NCGR_PEP_ID=MMETSP1095-20130614/545_1 /TAXON_ID=96789 ORGANISM="Chromulina nebulosa, Strain UTEXLB2642" /NCGR_SAMPLE_ID=MMETSP1095 /ASSEMBLY_ACC=CAM_ASM_000446 /LENGTH=587 /DNA_ID=CAMNT_0042110753 /DNA_START=13 /DNA_END=1776 /DNA_ORIENTATION=+